MSKGEQTRQLIIEKAAPIFNTKGIEATAMSDIMFATKLSKGSLYVHFKNKEELTAEVFAYNMKLLIGKVGSAIGQFNGAKDKLFAFINVLTDLSKLPVIGGCPMINFGVEADDTNPVIAKKVALEIEKSHDLISYIISSGINSGEFKPDWDYRKFAHVAFAMIEGAVIISRISGNDLSVKIIKEKLEEMVMEQIL